MTEIQLTKLQLANYVCGELHREKPFNLKLDAGQTGALYNIASESHHLHSGFVRKLEATLRPRVNNGTGVILEVGSDADLYYLVLRSYIAKHTQPTNSIDQFIAGGGFDKAFESAFGLPDGVVMALGEVS